MFERCFIILRRLGKPWHMIRSEFVCIVPLQKIAFVDDAVVIVLMIRRLSACSPGLRAVPKAARTLISQQGRNRMPFGPIAAAQTGDTGLEQ